jgi:hypothetical protein
MENTFKYKYNENKALAEIEEYINGTYGQHYVGNGEIQTVDFWNSLGSLDTTARDTAIKYLARYGKKGGYNRKDLLKAAHYIVLMLYADEARNKQPWVNPMGPINVELNVEPYAEDIDITAITIDGSYNQTWSKPL